MIKPVSIWLGPRELRYCKEMAELAEIGGHSLIREEDREVTLQIDQLVGQIGQYALALYLLGEPSKYYAQRMIANIHPEIGDSGQDLIGANVDVKTSLMRASQDPMEYVLPVRPKELHEGHVYILALIEPNGESSLKVNEPLLVHLVGWATTDDIMSTPEEDGIFKGAHVIQARKLHPLPPIQWDWRDYDTTR